MNEWNVKRVEVELDVGLLVWSRITQTDCFCREFWCQFLLKGVAPGWKWLDDSRALD